ncbi:hypothetical protein C2G38_2185769 [Gigaspora rosea]|uniref:SWIM-type domain-containing protein n=1 Tax=Gigaspora rosea TaxID=44941 RepID=A0A397V8M6_9GLOM|nr:hypothetical protein C2G38_2185769 [Gigaspora rosea]
MAFKIVGRSKSKKEALELGEAYRLFIKSLPLMEITKDSLCKPMTTNNLTERINKSVEGRRVGTQPINSFIERPVEEGFDIYFYVKKGNSGFRSPYTMRKINIDNKSFELLQQMIDKLASKHSVMQQNDYYLVNISTGECTCLDFIWNSSFRDICKHVHAARLFDDIENNKITLNSTRRVTEKDPFCPMEMPARRISDVGTPKMHGAKPRKSNGNKSINYIIDDDPMQLDNEIELSALFEMNKTLTNDRKEQSDSLAPSIQRQVTAAICNCKRNISNNKLVQNSINVKSTNKNITRLELKNLFFRETNQLEEM